MIYTIVCFALIALLDLVPIVKKRAWRALAGFLVLFIPGLAIALMLVMNKHIPSMMLLMDKALKALKLSY